jgi:uncharacterized membrane protein
MRQYGGTMTRRPHRNRRGLFLGAVLGAVVGYFAGRALGNPAIGIVLGTLAGSALLYRVNPGPWNRP